VLCQRCESLLSGLSRTTPELRRRWSESGKPLGPVLCARCGGVLPTEDIVNAMLTKRSQLSRFGLGGEDRPLLDRLAEGK
jgi:hypothetical protein